MSKPGAPFMQRVETVCPTGPIRCRRCADGVPKTTTSHAHRHLGLTCPIFSGQALENGIVFCRRETYRRRRSSVCIRWSWAVALIAQGCHAWFPKVSSRATRHIRCRPSPSPTVNVHSMPACPNRAQPHLGGSSRRLAPTHTRTRTPTHTNKHTHTHTHTHARAHARARARTHAHAHAPAREHGHAHARTRTHTRTRDDPPRQSAATASAVVGNCVRRHLLGRHCP